MSARVVLASRNAKKVAELARILDNAGLDVELISAAELPGAPEVAETGATFEENALLKAVALASFSGLPALADDSGLTVEALNHMPGILSARWSGAFGVGYHGGVDQANVALVLDQLADTPDDRRAAKFVCAAALALPDGRSYVLRGELTGTILRAPRGDGGFGYDPIFVPKGLQRTSAELSGAEKDEISHRGRALRELVPVLREVLAPDLDRL